MGVVYKARDPIINRLVALKKIKANVADSPTLLERFYREAYSAGNLQHPNIVTIHDVGEDEGVPFIVMEFVDGQNLGSLIAQRAPIPLSLKLLYAVEACRAFTYAHKQGIVHRDIKPGNIMVSKEGAVKVVDFGIARVLENSKTQTGMLIGTFAYMPPEVFNGEHADERSDIFSFGVLLYELFAYTRPFPGEIPASLMQSICLKEPIPLRQAAPDCPPELEAVVHRALMKSVTERTQSMEDLLLELDAIYKGLQGQTSADLVSEARALIQQGELTRARELLIQALQVDFTNRPARALLDEVNSALRRIQIRPRVEKHVHAGRALLAEGKIQEAQLEAETALKLDSSFEPAEELLRQVRQEMERAKLISEWLQAAGERLAEGSPEEAEAFVLKIQDIDPINNRAASLHQQVLEEKARRKRRADLLETMQQARTLWMQQKYEDCIDLLTSLGGEFGEEEEVRKLLATAREDQAEQQKRQMLERARTLMVAGSYDECKSLLAVLSGQFPNDQEILGLLEQAQKDEVEHRKIEGLTEARNLLAARRYEDCLALLTKLKLDFPEANEIAGLVEAVREDREAEQKEQGLKEARSLLASQRYDECRELLTGLQRQFPADPEIPKLVAAVREEQAEQHRLEGLSEAQKLLSSKQYSESLALLDELKTQFPDDKEILRLVEAVHKDQAEQQRLQGLAEAQNLRAAKQYTESLTVLDKLKTRFPDDKEIPRLIETVQKDQAEQHRLYGLAEAQKLGAAKQYAESLALLNKLKTQFPDDREVRRLIETVEKDQAEQRRLEGLSEARKLLSAKQHGQSLALLEKLKTQFPDDDEILRLAETVQKDQAEQRRLRGLSEARKLLSARQYAESVTVLNKLKTQFPDDKEIPRLVEAVQKEQAEQRRLEGLLEAQKSFVAKQYGEALALLSALRTQFPDDKEIPRLAEAVQKEQAEHKRLQSLAEARKLRAAKQYAEALTLLGSLKTQFPDDKEILRIDEVIQKDQAEQRKSEGLLKARKFLASKQYPESLALLSDLKTQFPNDKEILRLAEAVRKDQAEQQRVQSLAEARKLRAAKQYAEALSLLGSLKAQFPDDQEIPRLVEGIRKDQTEQQRQQGLSEARQLLASKRVDDSFALLKELRKSFPHDDDITRLLATMEQERAEQQKQRQFAEARTLLGSRSYDEARTVLDPLLAANPKDAGALKLRALISEEQEKAARSERRTQQLQVLKKLVSDESYEAAIARAGELLRDFPKDPDFVRLLEFARNRKEQVERERQLNGIVAEVQKFIDSNELAEAIAAARLGLASFEGNSDLKRLLDQAESQRKKEFTRLQIQQRIREIKIKIHREEFSDAVRLAQDALTTLGPDTDLTQLLTSAQVESQARERKRDQGRKLDDVRALMELGDLEGATLLLDNTIKDEGLDTTDPRVERLSKEIAAATAAKEHSLVPAVPESPAKEYALLQGPPQVVAPEEQGPAEEQAAPTATASQVTPSLPQSGTTPQPELAPEPTIQEVEVSAEGTDPESAPLTERVDALPALVPLWKRPSSILVELLGLILAVSTVTYFLRHSKPLQGTSQNISQPPATARATPTPDTQQRDLIAAADKAVAQGDFSAAKSALERAKNVSGPLNSEIDQKLGDVERAINNATTAAVLRQEETFWSQATAYTQNGQFAEAQEALRAILKLPPDGRRKVEARQYLTGVIPRRQREERLFAQAQLAMSGKDSRSLQQAADLFGEVAKLNGPRQQAALKFQQDVLANANRLNALSALTDGARQDMKLGEFRSARQKAMQLQQAGGDPAPLSQEINEAEQARFSQLDASLNQLKQRTDDGAVQSLRDLQPELQALADGGGLTANDARREAASIPDAITVIQARVRTDREEAAYQQSIQRYNPSSNDKGALEASRSDFQSIVNGGGHRVADARKIVGEINAKLDALSQPPKPDEVPAVRAAIERYMQAFDRRDADALRQAWPTMSDQFYASLKSSFAGASAIQIGVANEKIDLGADGTTAVVNADFTQNYTPKGEKTLVRKDHTVFHLVKSSGNWVIRDLQ